ncbi:hypothetical protein HI914_03002 [Erysiphe necator]|nr:hypothetical protein HI914_03002 [Erysiphe necator]
MAPNLPIVKPSILECFYYILLNQGFIYLIFSTENQLTRQQTGALVSRPIPGLVGCPLTHE